MIARKTAEACFVEIIGEKNPEYFFVATQDFDMRKKFRGVPGVPLIFGLRNALLLEPPSAFQHDFVKTSEENRSHVTELEYNMLINRTKSILTNEASGHSSDENEGPGDQNLERQPVRKKHSARKRMDIKDKPQFKRKKARAPNPLSCKKKKKDVNPKPAVEEESKAGDNVLRRRSRKRKRSRKEVDKNIVFSGKT